MLGLGSREAPRTRYDRTLRYFAMVAFGGTAATMKAADVLVRIHTKGVGIEPSKGTPYDANDPASQLWIHLTAWHSILYAYERYGPGRLSPEDEARYWAECAIAAELQTCDPADVPRTREGVRAYFERVRPSLRGSETARETMDHLLNAYVMLPPGSAWPRRLADRIASHVLRRGTIATMPRWMRELSGLRQSRAVDVLVRPVLRVAFWLASRNPRIALRLLGILSPGTVPVIAPVLLGIPPKRPETLLPEQARQRYGYAKPAEAHLEFRTRQRQKALAGEAPSDAGLAESERILGSR